MTVTSKPAFTLYDHTSDSGELFFSGTFEACFTAYEPFGKMLRTAYTDIPMKGELEATGILPTAMMPPMPVASGGNFLIYNPGTEWAQTVIRVAGDAGEGILIRNLTTGQRCRVIDLKPDSLLEGAVLE